MQKLIILVIIVAVFYLGISAWWNNGLLPVNAADKEKKSFVIAPQTSVRTLAYDLKAHELIRDPIVFFLLVKKLGLDGRIQAGDFTLSPSQTTEEIAQALTHGTVDVWVTIPEGKRADEIADLLSQKVPTYQASWRALLEQNEGYLFPDTYLIPKDADINTVLTIMKNNFAVKYASVPNAPKDEYSKNRIVTIASMIEREAKLPEDRPLVASVIENRLNAGWPLQIDATIQYALGYQPASRSWWKKDLTVQDTHLNSPYNTYVNPGLPPTPISNPGLDSIQAALHPAQTNYLYYVSDKNGKNHYSETLEGQNAAIQKYGL